MNCRNTSTLLSSPTFQCCPAGLSSVKYPSSSVLRFPAKNSYDGVTARCPAGLSSVKYPYSSVLRFPAKNSYDVVTARCNNNEDGGNVMKIREDGDEELSTIMFGDVEIYGPKKDAEAIIARVVRYRRDQKIIKFAQLTLVCTFIFIYVFKPDFGWIYRYLKSLFATGSGLTALVSNPLFLVTLTVTISLPIANKINEHLKVIIEHERMKLFFIKNRGKITTTTVSNPNPGTFKESLKESLKE